MNQHFLNWVLESNALGKCVINDYNMTHPGPAGLDWWGRGCKKLIAVTFHDSMSSKARAITVDSLLRVLPCRHPGALQKS